VAWRLNEAPLCPLFLIRLGGRAATNLSGWAARPAGPALDDDCLAVPETATVRVPHERISQDAEEFSPSVSQVNGSEA
jgi:hypothetical protein